MVVMLHKFVTLKNWYMFELRRTMNRSHSVHSAAHWAYNVETFVNSTTNIYAIHDDQDQQRVGLILFNQILEMSSFGFDTGEATAV